MDKFKLLGYAAKYWGTHAVRDAEDAVKDLCFRLFNDRCKLTCVSQVMHLPSFRYTNYSQEYPRDVNGLHIVALFSLSHITEFLLIHRYSGVDTQDSNGRTPLAWASRNGREGVVRLLATRDNVNINIQDGDSRTPLSLVAENSHEEVVKILLNNAAAPDTPDYVNRTPLSWAAAAGHTEVVRLLLSQDTRINVNIRDTTYGRSPLSWAAEKGHIEVAK